MSYEQHVQIDRSHVSVTCPLCNVCDIFSSYRFIILNPLCNYQYYFLCSCQLHANYFISETQSAVITTSDCTVHRHRIERTIWRWLSSSLLSSATSCHVMTCGVVSCHIMRCGVILCGMYALIAPDDIWSGMRACMHECCETNIIQSCPLLSSSSSHSHSSSSSTSGRIETLWLHGESRIFTNILVSILSVFACYYLSSWSDLLCVFLHSIVMLMLSLPSPPPLLKNALTPPLISSPHLSSPTSCRWASVIDDVSPWLIQLLIQIFSIYFSNRLFFDRVSVCHLSHRRYGKIRWLKHRRRLMSALCETP